MGKSQETELLDLKIRRVGNFVMYFLFPVNKSYIDLD